MLNELLKDVELLIVFISFLLIAGAIIGLFV